MKYAVKDLHVLFCINQLYPVNDKNYISLKITGHLHEEWAGRKKPTSSMPCPADKIIYGFLLKWNWHMLYCSLSARQIIGL